MQIQRNKIENKLTQQQRTELFLSKCYIICPRCLTAHPFGTKTCSVCMEILDPKERIFQHNIQSNVNCRYNLIKVEFNERNKRFK